MSFSRSAAKPHQIHLQHHLLSCTTYTIITKHKQIGTLTPATLANPSSTQGFLVFICHPELNSRDAILSHNSRNATCLTLSRAQLKGYVSSHNSRNTSKLTFKVS
ncbi:hypothetical protein DEO72_LG11g2089 [Vigna unguiculata]|uniref:Uncharacterized protein n=1 Tax=Vigna unguiculata TaxID=3917 RepID=A0A4D6NQ72_VIGUN|nr:hypothetical protein DEO72_LG11g2089 [Vigna unguiculata]